MNKLNEHELQSIFENFSECPVVIRAVDEMLSLREQLAELKALPPIGQVISCNGNKTLGWINDAPEGTLLFTAAKPVDVSTIQDELIEQVGVMCDRAVNIHEKNVYGEAYCVLKYGILPYLRKQGK